MKLQSLFTQSVGWPACSFEYGARFVNANARNCFKVQPPAAVGVQMVKHPSAHKPTANKPHNMVFMAGMCLRNIHEHVKLNNPTLDLEPHI